MGGGDVGVIVGGLRVTVAVKVGVKVGTKGVKVVVRVGVNVSVKVPVGLLVAVCFSEVGRVTPGNVIMVTGPTVCISPAFGTSIWTHV